MFMEAKKIETEKPKAESDVTAGASVAVLLFVIPSQLWLGFALSKIYGWLLLPTTRFAIPLVAWCGVTIMLPLLRRPQPIKGKFTFWSVVGECFLYPAVGLGIAWVIKHFV